MSWICQYPECEKKRFSSEELVQRHYIEEHNNRGYYKLTPDEVIEALEARFQLGYEQHKDNLIFPENMNKITNLWIINRLAHLNCHTSNFILHFMQNNLDEVKDDDGAAIMWFGALVHMLWLKAKKDANPNP
jgi:hypothetical protein